MIYAVSSMVWMVKSCRLQWAGLGAHVGNKNCTTTWKCETISENNI
jgi:hypothetical protein